METTPLDSPELYINRELSLLEFNRRVLHQVQSGENPLLERLRFLTICCTNLDEFFEIRVASLLQQVAYDISKSRADGNTPQQLMEDISRIAHELVDAQYEALQSQLRPALEAENIRLLNPEDWNPAQAKWVLSYFQEEALPVLTPIGLDPAHPFPQVLNKGLNLIVELKGEDAFGRQSGIAIIQVPRCLPRLIRIPSELSKKPGYDFVQLSPIIQSHVNQLFPGMEVQSCNQFRVTRNGDLWVEEEEIDDLLKALEGELPTRRFSEAVRLEVSHTLHDDLVALLLEKFNLKQRDLYRVRGPVNLHRLAAMIDLVEQQDLKFPPFIPALPLASGENLFEQIRTKDILLHHPYQSFYPVVEMVRQAASDPNVLAIKQTLYRTGADSPMVAALLDAAKRGKEVTVVIELRARFDEAANIDVANRLQGSGANVVYGIVGYKAHGKMLLVVRREDGRLRRYVHMGTGNYHTRTARAYTDFGLMTDDDAIGEDVHQLFMQMTGLGQPVSLKKVIPSPRILYQTLLEWIEAEIEEAKAGRPARIVAKVNNLSDDGIIRALYRASQAGVKVDLVVRTICGLRPGIPGVSDNIVVRSVVGRFLEHTRVYYFYAKGEELLYCASADLMRRNLHRRVEAAFPIEDPILKARVLEEGLWIYLRDNRQSWSLGSDGHYSLYRPEDKPPCIAQSELLSLLSQKMLAEPASS